MSAGAIAVDLSGFAIAIRCDRPDLAEGLADLWSGFRAGAGAGEAALAVDVVPGSAADGVGGSPGDKRIASERSADGSVELRMAEGRARMAADGRSAVLAVVPRTELPERVWAAHNLTLAAIAWSLSMRGRGAVIHGATAVVAGRAFVLVGPEGSGKSTFAAAAAAAGVVVAGEDLAVVDLGGDAPRVLASPFRVERATHGGPGRWPLAAVLVPRHAAEPGLEAVAPLVAASLLVGNLPYLSPDLAATIAARLLDAVPARRLRFRPDGSFVPLLARFAADGERRR